MNIHLTFITENIYLEANKDIKEITIIFVQ